MPDLTDVTVPARFRGPPSSGNGGWSAGALALRAVGSGPGQASLAQPTVTVSLLAPPPLDVPMSVTASEDADGPAGDEVTVLASYDGRPVASARRTHDPVLDVEPVPAAVARAARASFVGLTSHPFPTCFGCGTGRAEGDGLRIFPGRVADVALEPGGEPRPRVAATWTPQPTDAGSAGGSDPEAVPRASVPTTWAALDCVGGWAGDLEDRLMVLGRMTARLDSLPVIGEEHVVVGLGRRREGRKTWTSASLYDATGRVVASAEHLWIAVDPADFA